MGANITAVRMTGKGSVRITGQPYWGMRTAGSPSMCDPLIRNTGRPSMAPRGALMQVRGPAEDWLIEPEMLPYYR